MEMSEFDEWFVDEYPWTQPAETYNQRDMRAAFEAGQRAADGRMREVLRNAVSALVNLGAPSNLCELVEARAAIALAETREKP